MTDLSMTEDFFGGGLQSFFWAIYSVDSTLRFLRQWPPSYPGRVVVASAKHAIGMDTSRRAARSVWGRGGGHGGTLGGKMTFSCKRLDTAIAASAPSQRGKRGQ